ncbi:MAG: glycosyltransferase family 2 protein [Thermoproteota archaeon]
MENLLAIVIPAYKGAYLSKTLESIANQTVQRFILYIGDDASPDPIEEIVQSSQVRKDRLVYRRFPENLGRKALTEHWNRCIAMCSEPYVWLFSDDDVMTPDCVESFYRALGETNGKYDLYRFQTSMINNEDKVIAMNPPHPKVEAWEKFAYFLLRQLRFACQQEMIFRRRKYDSIGSFINFPLAWCSDHAFAIACAKPYGIYTMEEGRVLFRQSGTNFSSQRGRQIDRQKLMAAEQFVAWLMTQFNDLDVESFPNRETMRLLAKERFLYSLRLHGCHRSAGEFLRVYRFLLQTLGEKRFSALTRIGYYELKLLVEKMKRFQKIMMFPSN